MIKFKVEKESAYIVDRKRVKSRDKVRQTLKKAFVRAWKPIFILLAVRTAIHELQIKEKVKIKLFSWNTMPQLHWSLTM